MSHGRTGLVGSLMFAASLAGAGAALAQAAGSPAASNQAVPGATAQRSCSGFACLFAPAKATPTPAVEPLPTPPTETAAAAAPAKPQPVKPRPVTIAVEGADAARLHALTEVLPKGGVKLVEARHDDADLRVTSTPRPTAEHVGLYTAQLHVVAGRGINAIGDLQGKVVSFGPVAGQTRAAARAAFASLGVDVKDTPLALDNALDGLTTGDIDAVVMLAPEPDAALAALRAPDLHLLPWPDGAKAPDGTAIGVIPRAAYPALGASAAGTRAVNVAVVLEVTAKGHRQAAAKAALAALAQHAAALTGRGFDLIGGAPRNGQHLASVERR